MLTKTTTLLAKNSNGRLSYIFGRLILVHFFSFRTNFGQKFPTLRYNCYNAKTNFRSTDKKKTKKNKELTQILSNTQVSQFHQSLFSVSIHYSCHLQALPYHIRLVLPYEHHFTVPYHPKFLAVNMVPIKSRALLAAHKALFDT